jgi:hypothetical protein
LVWITRHDHSQVSRQLPNLILTTNPIQLTFVTYFLVSTDRKLARSSRSWVVSGAHLSVGTSGGPRILSCLVRRGTECKLCTIVFLLCAKSIFDFERAVWLERDEHHEQFGACDAVQITNFVLTWQLVGKRSLWTYCLPDIYRLPLRDCRTVTLRAKDQPCNKS